MTISVANTTVLPPNRAAKEVAIADLRLCFPSAEITEDDNGSVVVSIGHVSGSVLGPRHVSNDLLRDPDWLSEDDESSISSARFEIAVAVSLWTQHPDGASAFDRDGAPDYVRNFNGTWPPDPVAKVA